MRKRKIDLIPELKIWSIYFLTILASLYLHEIGHCIPAWTHGYWAIPTPAKGYSSVDIPANLKQYISLGGILGTVLFSIVILLIYVAKNHKYNSVVLAGSVAMPAAYTLRFILAGRGHDSTEFQEAQAALGWNYSGHSLDWLFLLLCLVPVAIWIGKTRPNYRIIPRLAIGFLLTILFIVSLQVINNFIFDRLFESK